MTEGYLQVPQVWESEGVESEEESLAGKVAVAPLKLQKQLGHVTEEVPKVWESEGVESEEESLAGKVEKERSLWRGSVGVGCTKLRPSAHVAYQAVAYQAVVHAAYQAVAYQAVVHAAYHDVDVVYAAYQAEAVVQAAYQAEAVVHHAACPLQVVALGAVDHGGALVVVAVLQVAVVS